MAHVHPPPSSKKPRKPRVISICESPDVMLGTEHGYYGRIRCVCMFMYVCVCMCDVCVCVHMCTFNHKIIFPDLRNYYTDYCLFP